MSAPCSLRDASPASSLMAAFLKECGGLRRAFAARTGSWDLAEEAIQDLAVKISELSLDPATVILDVRAYLWRLGWNLILDKARSRKRMLAREERFHQSWLDDAAALSPNPESSAETRDRVRRIVSILKSQPEEVRDAFRLRRLEGATLADAARRLGVSTSQIERRVRAAHLAIERGLQERETPPGPGGRTAF